jgi:hypothetical protein
MLVIIKACALKAHFHRNAFLHTLPHSITPRARARLAARAQTHKETSLAEVTRIQVDYSGGLNQGK